MTHESFDLGGGEKDKSLEPAHESTKNAFLEKVIKLTKLTKDKMEREIVISDQRSLFPRSSFEQDEHRSLEESAIAELTIVDTVAENVFKHNSYTLRRNGSIEHRFKIDDSRSKAQHSTLLEEIVRGFIDEEIAHETGASIVTDQELQEINTLLDTLLTRDSES